jgi:hypothetical protein
MCWTDAASQRQMVSDWTWKLASSKASYTKNNISLRPSLNRVDQGLVPAAALAQRQPVGQPGTLHFACKEIALGKRHGFAARHEQGRGRLNGWR